MRGMRQSSGWAAPSVIALALLLLLLLPLLYVASIGPAWVSYHNNHISHETFSTAYAPVFRIAKSSRWSEKHLLLYLNWWYDQDGLPQFRRNRP
jgi:hypothetical protein